MIGFIIIVNDRLCPILVVLMVIIKEVKEYSKRKRINILKDDGFKPGDKVVILPLASYDDMIAELQRLEQLVTDYELQDNDTSYDKSDGIFSDVLEHIYQQHQKQLENKDKIIQARALEINRLKSITSKYNIAMNGLSTFDMIFKKKHKQLIEDFQSSIWIQNDDVLEADVNRLID